MQAVDLTNTPEPVVPGLDPHRFFPEEHKPTVTNVQESTMEFARYVAVGSKKTRPADARRQ